MSRLPGPLGRLAHPRSRRSRLWACVYCGAVDREAATGAGSAGTEQGAPDRR